jgi:hypothetical protein
VPKPYAPGRQEEVTYFLSISKALNIMVVGWAL